MTLRIRATVENGVWTGPPFSSPATISDTFGTYDDWRKAFDHDGDPATPPRDFGPHKGVDGYMERPRNAIHAADTGKALWVGYGHPVMGNWVVVSHHTDEPPGDDFPASYYLHLGEIAVGEGEPVDDGTVIGFEGSTGAVTGRHLHFAVRMGDEFVDPMQFLVGDESEPPIPTLDTDTAMEWFVSEYYLSGGSHGGTKSQGAPEFERFADDGKTEEWTIRLLRPGTERPS